MFRGKICEPLKKCFLQFRSGYFGIFQDFPGWKLPKKSGYAKVEICDGNWKKFVTEAVKFSIATLGNFYHFSKIFYVFFWVSGFSN